MRYTTMHVAVCFAIICLPLVAAQGLIGGWVDVSIYHPDIQWAARFADAALGPFTRIVAKLRAQQQVSSKHLYVIYVVPSFQLNG